MCFVDRFAFFIHLIDVYVWESEHAAEYSVFYSELSLQPKAIGLICGLFKKKVTFVAEMS